MNAALAWHIIDLLGRAGWVPQPSVMMDTTLRFDAKLPSGRGGKHGLVEGPSGRSALGLVISTALVLALQLSIWVLVMVARGDAEGVGFFCFLFLSCCSYNCDALSLFLSVFSRANSSSSSPASSSAPPWWTSTTPRTRACGSRAAWTPSWACGMLPRRSGTSDGGRRSSLRGRARSRALRRYARVLLISLHLSQRC